MKKIIFLLLSMIGAGTSYANIEIDDLLGFYGGTSIEGVFNIEVLEDAIDGACLGVVQIQANGNSGPYTLTLIDRNGQPTEYNKGFFWEIQEMCPGEYMAILINRFGCEFNETLEVKDIECPELIMNEGLFTDAIYQPSDCIASDGGVYFRHGLPFENIGEITHYQLYNEEGMAIEAIGLTSGEYYYEIENNLGCIYSYDFSLGSEIETDIFFIEDTACEGESNGQLEVVISALPETYTVLWNNGEENEIISNLSVGEYCVTVSFSENCSISQCYDLNSTTDEINLTGEVISSCPGRGGGIILFVEDYDWTGGNADLSFIWSDGSSHSSRSDLSAGEYCVTVTNECNAYAEACFEVMFENIPSIEIEARVIGTCESLEYSTGSIEITVEGGRPPFIYEWSTGATSQNISGLSYGDYCVTVTDKTACRAKVECFTVWFAPFDIELIEIVHCTDGCDDAVIEVEADYMSNISLGEFSYDWFAYLENNEYYQNTGARIEDIPQPGLYNVRVRDERGCVQREGIQIEDDCSNIPDIPDYSNEENHSVFPVSSGFPDGFISLKEELDKPEFVYKWSGPNGFEYNGFQLAGNPILAGVGTYTLEVSNGCDTGAFEFEVKECENDFSVEVVSICNDCIASGAGYGRFKFTNHDPSKTYYYDAFEEQRLINLDENDEFTLPLYWPSGEANLVLFIFDEDLCTVFAEFTISPNFNSYLDVISVTSYRQSGISFNTSKPRSCDEMLVCRNSECNLGSIYLPGSNSTTLVDYRRGPFININHNTIGGGSCSGSYFCGNRSVFLTGDIIQSDGYDPSTNSCVTGTFCHLEGTAISPLWRWWRGESLGFLNEPFFIEELIPDDVINNGSAQEEHIETNGNYCELNYLCNGAVVYNKELIIRKELNTTNYFELFEEYDVPYLSICQLDGAIVTYCGSTITEVKPYYLFCPQLLVGNGVIANVEKVLKKTSRIYGTGDKPENEFSNNFRKRLFDTEIKKNLSKKPFELDNSRNIFPFSFELHPNPSSSKVNLVLKQQNFDFEQKLVLTLKSSAGQILMQKEIIGIDKMEIDLSLFPSGIYFINLFNMKTGEVAAGKVVKQ